MRTKHLCGLDSLRGRATTYAHLQPLSGNPPAPCALALSSPGLALSFTRSSQDSHCNRVPLPSSTSTLRALCRSWGNQRNEPDDANQLALLISDNEKSALAGHTAKEDRLYLGGRTVAVTTYHGWQAHAGDDGASDGDSSWGLRGFCQRPLKDHIVSASAVWPKTTIEFITFLQAGNDAVLLWRREMSLFSRTRAWLRTRMGIFWATLCLDYDRLTHRTEECANRVFSRHRI